MSTIASSLDLPTRHAPRPCLPLPPPDGRYLVRSDAPAVLVATDDGPATARPRLPARVAVLVSICAAGALTAASLGASAWDTQSGDAAAAAIPVVAMVGMALVVVRRCPDHRTETIRTVGSGLSAGLVMAAIALLAAMLALPDARPELLGPALSVATIGSYLGLWGLRSPALLRSVAILGLLTWTWVADAVHAVARTSLELPSDMVYRRLAALPLLGIADEPWRLHTAVMHDGTLVVVATIVIGFAASRWRLTIRNVVDVGVVAFIALVVHHAVLLSSPVDQYSPSDTARLASHPVVEVGIAIVAVAALACVRWRRDGTTEPLVVTPLVEPSSRDPFIFSSADPGTNVPIVAALLATALPLWALVVVLAV
jgi:hypothetical protein